MPEQSKGYLQAVAILDMGMRTLNQSALYTPSERDYLSQPTPFTEKFDQDFQKMVRVQTEHDLIQSAGAISSLAKKYKGVYFKGAVILNNIITSISFWGRDLNRQIFNADAVYVQFDTERNNTGEGYEETRRLTVNRPDLTSERYIFTNEQVYKPSNGKANPKIPSAAEELFFVKKMVSEIEGLVGQARDDKPPSDWDRNNPVNGPTKPLVGIS